MTMVTNYDLERMCLSSGGAGNKPIEKYTPKWDLLMKLYIDDNIALNDYEEYNKNCTAFAEMYFELRDLKYTIIRDICNRVYLNIPSINYINEEDKHKAKLPHTDICNFSIICGMSMIRSYTVHLPYKHYGYPKGRYIGIHYTDKEYVIEVKGIIIGCKILGDSGMLLHDLYHYDFDVNTWEKINESIQDKFKAGKIYKEFNPNVDTKLETDNIKKILGDD